MNNFSHGTYKLWDLKTRKVVYSRDVTFFEDKNIQDELQHRTWIWKTPKMFKVKRETQTRMMKEQTRAGRQG